MKHKTSPLYGPHPPSQSLHPQFLFPCVDSVRPAEEQRLSDQEARLFGNDQTWRGRVAEPLSGARIKDTERCGLERWQQDKWRRGWDSNPRYARAHNGFRDRPVRPLRHLSTYVLIDFFAPRLGSNFQKGHKLVTLGPVSYTHLTLPTT